FVPEAAAYRLDRLLGIDMVPVAVRRVLDGEEGALALGTDSLTGWEEGGATTQAWCPRDDQLALARSFDALLGIDARAPEQMKMSDGSGRLLLGGNHAILESDATVAIPEDERPLTPTLRARLLALDEAALAAALGEVLDA